MAERADAFLALPGGFGTLEEIFEALALAATSHPRKPCGLLNVEGYYDGLLAMLDHAVAEGFLRSENRGLIVSDSVPGRLIELLLGC